MDIHCTLGGEPRRLHAVLEPGASHKGAAYIILNQGQFLVTVIRYPNGHCVTEEETKLTAEEVDAIGNAINEAIARAHI